MVLPERRRTISPFSSGLCTSSPRCTNAETTSCSRAGGSPVISTKTATVSGLRIGLLDVISLKPLSQNAKPTIPLLSNIFSIRLPIGPCVTLCGLGVMEGSMTAVFASLGAQAIQSAVVALPCSDFSASSVASSTIPQE